MSLPLVGMGANGLNLMAYTVESTATFDKEFTKRHSDKTAWLQTTKEKLKENPYCGKPLGDRLHGLWQLRTGPFRLWYEIDNAERKVTLKFILHKNKAEKLY